MNTGNCVTYCNSEAKGSNMAYQCAENLKLNRATVAGIKSSPKAGFYGRIKFLPAIFDIDALARSGK